MKIDIQSLDFELTDALHKYIGWRLGCALSRRDEHIQRVMVRLSDVNGPRGGTDKCCQIQVFLDRCPDVVIEDVEADMYTAIDRAASRASRTVGRRVVRQRVKERFSAIPRRETSSL